MLRVHPMPGTVAPGVKRCERLRDLRLEAADRRARLLARRRLLPRGQPLAAFELEPRPFHLASCRIELKRRRLFVPMTRTAMPERMQLVLNGG